MKKIHEICSPEVQSGDAFFLLFSALKILNSIISWPLQLRPPPASTSLISYSLSVRFGRASPLTTFLTPYVRKFPSTLSRDLLNWLCPAVLTFYLTKDWLKLPQEPGLESKRLPPAVWKSPYLLVPNWEVCDRCCNNGIAHLAHHQSQGRMPCVLSAL